MWNVPFMRCVKTLVYNVTQENDFELAKTPFYNYLGGSRIVQTAMQTRTRTRLQKCSRPDYCTTLGIMLSPPCTLECDSRAMSFQIVTI